MSLLTGPLSPPPPAPIFVDATVVVTQVLLELLRPFPLRSWLTAHLRGNCMVVGVLTTLHCFFPSRTPTHPQLP